MKQRFWLMKSEPNCYSFDNLLNDNKDQTTCWDGVRNYQARNLMRDDIRIGDGVLFYHSNIKEPAIVGIATVVREGYPDHTALDPRNDHFDPNSSDENPIWFMVDIQAVVPLPFPITRESLRQHPLLSGMDVLKRGNRLSVQPVSEQHWQAVLDLAGIDLQKDQ
jgi:predicted RNA-binding protein with PUA-like domain